MTKHENLDEYVDPTFYDQENNEFEPDGPFYLALAQQFGGSVLDLGCGTGRVTIPLAQRGIDMTGLDLARQMLGPTYGVSAWASDLASSSSRARPSNTFSRGLTRKRCWRACANTLYPMGASCSAPLFPPLIY
jgi:SAM-dependent methyltransferase